MDTKLKNAVIETFSDIMATSDFHLKDESHYWPEVHLWNDQCIFRFISDRGSIEGSFVNPIEKKASEKIKRPDGFPNGYPVYPVFSVWGFLYPNDKENYLTESWDLKERVNAIKKVLVERLDNVLAGDFPWTTKYQKHQSIINREAKNANSLLRFIKKISGR